MGYPVSLSELVAKVYQRTNFEGQATARAPFVSENEVIGHVNQGLTKYYEVLSNSTWAGTYFSTKWTFNTVNGREEYSLPGDFFRVQYVDFFVDPNAGAGPNSRAVSVYEYPVEDRNFLQGNLVPYLYAWNFKSTVYYRLKGQDNSGQTLISFRPIPAGVYKVRITYTQVCPRLVAPEDSLDFVNGWEELVILWAAQQVLVKGGPYDAIPFLQQQYAAEVDRIRSSAPKRDLQTAERVHILDDYSDYSFGYGGDGDGGSGY